MTTISSAAASVREQHRSTDGRFGVQPHAVQDAPLRGFPVPVPVEQVEKDLVDSRVLADGDLQFLMDTRFGPGGFGRSDVETDLVQYDDYTIAALHPGTYDDGFGARKLATIHGDGNATLYDLPDDEMVRTAARLSVVRRRADYALEEAENALIDAQVRAFAARPEVADDQHVPVADEAEMYGEAGGDLVIAPELDRPLRLPGLVALCYHGPLRERVTWSPDGIGEGLLELAPFRA